MAIKIKCPKCEATYEVLDSRAGQVGRCKCGQSIQIPEPATSEADLGIQPESVANTSLQDDALRDAASPPSEPRPGTTSSDLVGGAVTKSRKSVLAIAATIAIATAVAVFVLLPKWTGPKTLRVGLSENAREATPSKAAQEARVDLTPSSLARTKDVAEKIKVSRAFGEDSLGIEFRVNGYQSLTLLIANNSDAEVTIGSDVQGMGGDGGFLIWGTSQSDEVLRRRMYAMDARQLSALKDGKPVMWITGCSGQGLGLDSSVTDKYSGSWQEHAKPGGTAVIRQRLVYPLDAYMDYGIATPILQASDSLPFRLWIPVGSAAAARTVVAAGGPLSDLILDSGNPIGLRCLAVGWLADVPDKTGWAAMEKLAKDRNLPSEVRHTAIRWLGSEGSEASLRVVEAILWDRSSDVETGKQCVYALSWSVLDVAKAMRKKAAEGHWSQTIKGEAK